MLGCQDFCGYYDWTFHFVRRSFGPEAAPKLWATAIAKAQEHYTEAGLDKGLRGLYETWVTTGEDENCDWKFTLDEEKNVLRWDMYQCPSKGHLIQNDLNADEDYCDHCMGWIATVLDKIGGEVITHEHNHCGQCWAEMRLKGSPSESLAGLSGDITNDPRWSYGYIERWENSIKLPLLPSASASSDPAQVLCAWFANVDDITVLGRGPSAVDQWTKEQQTDAVIVTDPTYATRDVFSGEPMGVLIGDHVQVLKQVSERFHATPSKHRPLLMHMYLPKARMLDLESLGLPRPIPILPILVRAGLYRHEPFSPYPTTGVFALLLGAALNKRITLAGIDLYSHPTGRMYVGEPATPKWPDRHSEACDRAHLQLALDRLADKVKIHPLLAKLLAKPTAQQAANDDETATG
jgi:hypothetical protein